MAEEKPYAIPFRCDFGYGYGFKIMRNTLAISDLRLQSFCVDYIDTNSDLRYPLRLGGLHLPTNSKMSVRDLEYTCNAFRHLSQDFS